MNRPATNIYGGVDPLDLPVYRVGEAARYLGVPPSTLRAWNFGQTGFRRVIVPEDPKTGLLSFRNLVEAHVLSALRVHHRVPLSSIRRAIQFLKREVRSDRPLLELRLLTDGSNIFVRMSGDVLNVSRGGQVEISKIVAAYLRRIETDERGAVRLYPFTRKGDSSETTLLAEQPKLVVIDPSVSFGRPVIARTNIRTSVVAERYLAGESVEELAADYRRSPLEIEEAIRCETRVAA